MSKKVPKTAHFLPSESKAKNPRHYARIPDNLVQSLAFKDLDGKAPLVYLLLKIKFNGNNEKDLSLTYKEAGEYMNQRTFTKAIDELIDHGFIEVIR